MIIDVWLKIRDRENLNFLLSNLNFWLGVFGNDQKYNLYIYNENVKLPRFYEGYKIINREILLSDKECSKHNNLINLSNISKNWQATAFALSAPYIYLRNSPNKYIYNIDADDMILYGGTNYYLDKLEKIIQEKDLMTLSYDYIFSHNLFDQKDSMPNHWTFGFNLSNRIKMNSAIITILVNSKILSKQIKNLKLDYEVNLDILFSQFLLRNSKEEYLSFVTPDGLMHYNLGFKHITKYEKNRKCIEIHSVINEVYNDRLIKMHPKTLLIQ